eukprot:747418_1
MEGAINGDILCPFCGDCEVEYVGEQAGYDKVSINATYSTSLNVYAAGGDEVFQSGSLYCPQGGTCHLTCDGSYRGYYRHSTRKKICTNVDIHAHESSYLQIDVIDGLDMASVMDRGQIYTPEYGNTVVNLDINTQVNDNGSIMKRVQFFSKHGTGNMEINCNSDPGLEARCVSDAAYVNTVSCTESWTESCDLEYDASSSNMICGNSTTSVCAQTSETLAPTKAYINELCPMNAPSSSPT